MGWFTEYLKGEEVDKVKKKEMKWGGKEIKGK